jgi:hypothetical protein
MASLSSMKASMRCREDAVKQGSNLPDADSAINRYELAILRTFVC